MIPAQHAETSVLPLGAGRLSLLVCILLCISMQAACFSARRSLTASASIQQQQLDCQDTGHCSLGKVCYAVPAGWTIAIPLESQN